MLNACGVELAEAVSVQALRLSMAIASAPIRGTSSAANIKVTRNESFENLEFRIAPAALRLSKLSACIAEKRASDLKEIRSISKRLRMNRSSVGGQKRLH